MNRLSTNQDARCVRTGRALLLASALGLWLLVSFTAGCGVGDGDEAVTAPPSGSGSLFRIQDGNGRPVGGATVFLVPTADVDQRTFSGADVLGGASEAYDEPLEDAVALKGTTYPQAVTDGSGSAAIPGIPAGSYFTFVRPSGSPSEFLPGGSGGRTARDASSFVGTTVITLTSQPPTTATYLGTSACLACHGAYATQTTHAHRLGFAVPGQLSALQDDSRYPEFRDNWNRYKDAGDYTGGTVVWFYDFTVGRGFDKFKTKTTDPRLADPAAEVYVKGYLWRSTLDGKYRITLENVHPMAGMPDPMDDPPNLWHLDVELTYGGAVYKQRNLVSLPNRKGRYPLLQYQTDGDDGRYDRTRHIFRDYHLDWYWDDANRIFRYPAPTRAFEGNCTACHSTGFQRYQDAGTGEWLSTAVDDPGGAFDIDGDGSKDEINLGCEVCHGPGSAHRDWAASPANTGFGNRYIVRPDRLSPSREMMICGRCHDRPKGNGSLVNDEPLNAANEMPPVGISRRDYLASYVSRKGPGAGDYWSDDLHSKSHHQQYTDLLKSRKHRNGRYLVTCADCHDSHGASPFRNHLKHDPDDGVTGLCYQCHGTEIVSHMILKTGNAHAGPSTACVRCHMPEAAKTGSGRYGIIIPGGTTGTPADLLKSYFHNDIASHLFMAIPKRDHPDVKSILPGFAMPIPFTNTCGTGCHDVAPLQLKPGMLPVPLSSLQGPFVAEDDDYGTEASPPAK